jgi:hypothetical protein
VAARLNGYLVGLELGVRGRADEDALQTGGAKILRSQLPNSLSRQKGEMKQGSSTENDKGGVPDDKLALGH